VSEGREFVLGWCNSAQNAPTEGLRDSGSERIAENDNDKLEFGDEILLQAVDEDKLNENVKINFGSEEVNVLLDSGSQM
jgi:hypothetical protein